MPHDRTRLRKGNRKLVYEVILQHYSRLGVLLKYEHQSPTEANFLSSKTVSFVSRVPTLLNSLVINRPNIHGTIIIVLREMRHLPVQRHAKVVATLVALAAQFRRQLYVLRSIRRQEVARFSYEVRPERSVCKMTREPAKFTVEQGSTDAILFAIS